MTNCWMWSGATNGSGYGVCTNKTLFGKYVYAHRLLYEMRHGKIKNGELDHLCRNTMCVNPDHMEVVPHKENCRRGNLTSLNPEAVKVIKACGAKAKHVAACYGITTQSVYRIRLGRRWA